MSLDMQLLIIQCPGHGQQRRGGHVPNGRSFCIPSNEGAVDQFGPGAKAMSCRSSLSFALNARFESKLCVNLMPVLKSKLLVILRAFTHLRAHCQFCERPFSLNQSCPGLCAQEPGPRPAVEAHLWHG